MQTSYMLIAIYLLVGSISIGVFIHRSIQKKLEQHKFAIMLLASAIWVIAQAMEYWAPSLESKIFWFNIQWIGIIYAPVGFFLLILKLTGEFQWKKIAFSIVAIVIPSLLLVMIFTNNLHHLFVKEYFYQPCTGGVASAGWEPAIGYWITRIYVYFLAGISIFHLAWILFHFPRIFNNQIHWLLIASVIVLSVAIYERMVWKDGAIVQTSPIAMNIFTLTSVVLLSKFKKQDTEHTSAQILMHAIPFPIFILTQKCIIIDMNEPAEELIGKKIKQIKDEEFRIICPHIYQQVCDGKKIDWGEEETKKIQIPNSSLSYEASYTSVHNHLGNFQSYVLKLTPEGINGEQAATLQKFNAILKTLDQIAKEVITHNNIKNVFSVLDQEVKKLGLNYAYITLEEDRQITAIEHTSYGMEMILELEKRFNQTLFTTPLNMKEWLPLLAQLSEHSTIFCKDMTAIIQPSYSFLKPNVLLAILNVFHISTKTSGILHLVEYVDGKKGILCVLGDTLRSQDLLAFSIFGNQIGVAIEKAKLLEQEKTQRKNLERSNALVAALNQVVILSSVPTQTEELIWKMREELQGLGINFSVLTVDPKRKTAQIEYSQIEQLNSGRLKTTKQVDQFPSPITFNDWPIILKQIVIEKKPVFVERFGEILPDSVMGIKKDKLLLICEKGQIKYDSPIICTPKQFTDGRLMVLVIWGNEIREKNLPVFAIFASQIAQVYEKNSMLETEKLQGKELKRSNDLLDALSQVAAKVASSSGPEMVYATLETELKEIGLDSVFLVIEQEVDKDISQTNGEKYSKIVDELIRRKLQNKCIYLTQRPIELEPVFDGEPLYIGNFRHALDFLQETLSPNLSVELQNTFNTVHEAAGFLFPLNISGNVLGCIAIWSKELNEKDQAVLDVFISQIAISLENARLLEEERHQNEFLHQVIQSLTHPFYVVNVDDLSIEISNMNSKEEIINSQNYCHQLIHNHDEICSQSGITCPVNEVLQKKSTVDIIQQYNSSDKGRQIFQTRGYPIFDKHGNISQVIIYATDITEQEKSRAMLLRSERLVSVGRLAASVSHEIKNPMQSILGCIGLAQEALEENEDPEQFFVVAREAVTRVTNIVNRMRDLYRPVNDTRVQADINTLLDNVFRLTKKQFQDSAVELIWQQRDEVNLIWMVTDQIHQVFLNMVLNALDSMPEGGKLQISVQNTQSPDGIQIAFTDTGYGISGDDLVNIFDPFFTTKDTGTGLGLSISHEFIRYHGGWIDADSIIDQGTTFTLWLPQNQRKEKRYERANANPGS